MMQANSAKKFIFLMLLCVLGLMVCSASGMDQEEMMAEERKSCESNKPALPPPGMSMRESFEVKLYCRRCCMSLSFYSKIGNCCINCFTFGGLCNCGYDGDGDDD